MTSTPYRITDLERAVTALPAETRRAFERIYHVSRAFGQLEAPRPMHAWIAEQFGSLEAVQTQQVIKVTNRITLEGALFNPLRGLRPMQTAHTATVQEEIEKTRGDPFCNPLSGTPADTFGRIRGKRCVTAANVAKSDGLHGLIIFDEHDPLCIDEEAVHDYFTVALRWAKKAHNADRDARYFFLLWNCLWKAGASVIHGHAQMTLTRGMHYPKVESWRRSALLYRLGHGSDYFTDLIDVHTRLGLATTVGEAHLLASLTPIKEKELLVVGERPDKGFLRAVHVALDALVHRLGTRSFSLAWYWKPIDSVEEDWSGFPCIVRIVDRGDPAARTADMGAMELYAASVVASDPFEVAQALR